MRPWSWLADLYARQQQRDALEDAHRRALTEAVLKIAEQPNVDLDALREIMRELRARPWMSELWTVLLATIVGGAFAFPEGARRGFVSLHVAPAWFVFVVGAAITLAFGIRVATVTLTTLSALRKPPAA